jgi:hypothetical protein
LQMKLQRACIFCYQCVASEQNQFCMTSLGDCMYLVYQLQAFLGCLLSPTDVTYPH